ncbi:peptidyl-prolyl cis-trans isomerase [Photobacterium kishitanii]|uniref:peptidylprolyl isomerase n=1 Tax=Photobacterium kishitanii TaxID=318456 RepID=UPI000D170F5E|nr:peptidylprolyl isomerase [Photobacterium kishitanii]PSW61903.1 peptidyl-prolyl cis-trans isomerase [Photobacterium kishitanii]
MLKIVFYWLKKFIKDPFSHFLIAGAILFICYSFYHSGPSLNEVIITPSQITQQKRDDTTYFGSAPSHAMLNNDINKVILQRILSQEALKLGLEKGDPNLNAMLMQRFISYTTQIAKINAADTKLLHSYYLTHRQNYRYPDMYSLCYHFLSSQKEAHPVTAPISYQCLSNITKKALLTKLGNSIITTLNTITPKKWSNPISTPFGPITVKLIQHKKAGILSFKDAKSLLTNDYTNDVIDKKIADVIKEYRIQLPTNSGINVTTKTLLKNV